MKQLLRDTPTLEETARSAYKQCRKFLDFFMEHARRGYNFDAKQALEQTARNLETYALVFTKFPRLRPPINPPRPIYTKPPKPIRPRVGPGENSFKIETPSPEDLQDLYDRS
jgi:hypothetical protein